MRVDHGDLDLLADAEYLRAFVDVLADDLDRSEGAILDAIVTILAREQHRRANDICEVLRLGRVRQAASRELGIIEDA
jgi:hypothetical protein